MSTISQRSFTGGEISPHMYSRVDFAKYQTSLKKCKNFIPLKYGGADNRPGTQFINEMADSESESRLIPFVGSVANTALEFVYDGFNTNIRFYEDDAIILNAATNAILNITGTTTVTITHGGTFPTSNPFRISGLTGALGAELNGRDFISTFVDATHVILKNLDGTNAVITNSYVSGGIVSSHYVVLVGDCPISRMKYSQSGDVMVFSSQDFQTFYLKRVAADNWTFGTNLYGVFNSVGYSANITITQGGSAGTTTYRYAVAPVYGGVIGPAITDTVTPTNGSYASTATGNATLTAGNYNQISIGSTSGAYDYYNIYKENASGVYGLIGQTTSTTFRDTGITPDAANTFPDERFNIQSAGAVGFVQQRLFFGDITWLSQPRKSGVQLTLTERETIAGSAIGQFASFTKGGVLTDQSSLSFVAATKKFSPPRHILDLSKMVVMTENSELVINADGSPVTATNLSVKANSYNGCSEVPPIIINESCLYIQNRGNIVRDLTFDFNIDGFSGNEISIFGEHLFSGYEILDWTFQQYPNSNIWAVRDDGKLLCLTYLKEQQVLAWSQHEIGGAGKVSSVCAIPDGKEDAVYMIVERVINGKTVKYVEKLTSRFIDQNIVKNYKEASTDKERIYSGLAEASFVDSALVYDGRNFDTTKQVKITTSGTVDDILTMEANTSGTFLSTDEGNYIYVYYAGDIIRCRITAYTSGTSVQISPSKDIPAGLVNLYTSDWSKAVDQISGLYHLEQKLVSVVGDGFVDANPNNPAYELISVENGSITLPNAREYIVVGLPYVSDLQTLKIDTVQSETLSDKKMLINKVSVGLKDTRGIWIGQEEPEDINEFISGTEGLYEMKVRSNESYESPVDLKTDTDFVVIDSAYDNGGSVFIRQVDPVPATILSVHPTGAIPFKGG